MPIAVPPQNPNTGIGGVHGPQPFGLPGAAYQGGVPLGYPGEAYIGQGFFPQPPPAPIPETPVDMPARRTVFEGPRAHQKAVQGHQKEVIRRWLDTQGKARSAGTPIPEGPTNLNAGTRLNDLGSGANQRVFVAEPARPAQPIRYSGGVTTGGPASGGTRVVQAMPGSGAGTVPNGPVAPRVAGSGTSQTAARVAANAGAGGAAGGAGGAGGGAGGGARAAAGAAGGAARGPGGARAASAVRPTSSPSRMTTGLHSLMSGQSSGWRGAWNGAKALGGNALKGGAVAVPINFLAGSTNNPSIDAGAKAANIAWMAGPMPTAVAAGGVTAGDAGGRVVTGAPQWFSRDVLGNTAAQNQDTAWVQDMALQRVKDQIPTGIDDTVIDFLTDPLDPRNESRGMSSLPIIGDWFSGDGQLSEEEQAAQQAAAEQAALPSRLPDIMSEFGLSPEIQESALRNFDQDLRLYRTYMENGIPLPFKDPEGKPLDIAPEELEGFLAQQFLQSLPDLIDMDRQEQDMLARAAAFQATIGDVMAPYEQQSRALAEMYPSMLVNDNLSPEMRGPMQSYADAMSASTLAQANSYGAAGRMIPMVASLEGYLDSQNQLQSQIDQIIMQQALDEIRNGGGGEDEESLAADALG